MAVIQTTLTMDREPCAATPVPFTGEHHDAARTSVPLTALFVAAMRALESAKEDALFSDPCAVQLTEERLQDLEALEGYKEKIQYWTGAIALRTRYIDDWLAREAPRQFVILGSGLDTRVYRLEALRDCAVFELDFAGIQSAKRSILAAVPMLARTCVDVTANLVVDPWISRLQEAGFDPNTPTCWLMEGFVPYLLEEELRVLLRQVASCSAPGSSLLATFLDDSERTSVTAMHRYFVSGPEQIVELFTSSGWAASSPDDMDKVAARYGRSNRPWGYFFGNARIEGAGGAAAA